MCTLTFVPLESGAVTTANRDESPLRKAAGLDLHKTKDGKAFYIAREPVHGGTNMAIGKNGTVAVLLNGAFYPHSHNPPYRLSRGLLLLQSLERKDLKAFVEDFDFSDIEPFTLVFLHRKVEEVRWDGQEAHYAEFDVNQPKLWASAQLYSKAVRAKRQRWFREVLKSPEITADELLNFHFNGGDGDLENDLVMNRGGLVQTVSVTQFHRTTETPATLRHFNLVDKKRENFSWKL